MTKLTFSHGHALLVGVGGNLPVTIQDATALHNVLVDPTRAAYPSKQVEVLTETKATRQDILDAFDQLIARVNTDAEATVIVYFSGHGWRVTSPGNPTAYFLMPSGYNIGDLAGTAISGLEFTNKIEAIKARKLVVLLDCCHAGGVPQLKSVGESIEKAPLPPELLSLLETGSGRVVVASSLENEKSYTGTSYSVFTACLMEALEGKAAVKKDGFARILDVLIYLLDQVPQRAAGSQHPFVNKADNLSDNFALCYYAGGSKSVPGEASVSEPAAAPLTAGKRARLEQELKALQGERELLAEKVRRIRRALIIETSVVHRFQLEQQLQEDEASLTRLDGRIDEFEQILSAQPSAQNKEPSPVPAATEQTQISIPSDTMLSENAAQTGQFDVFLSYSEGDAAWVENLAWRLEDEKGLRVWLDKWILIPGHPEQQARARGIEQANSCAVCISERTPSGWFKRLIEKAMDRQTRVSSFGVIPVLLPNARNVSVNDFNDFLELNWGVNFRDADPDYAFHLLVCGVKNEPPGRWPPNR